MDAARAAFTRGVDVPADAEFTGFATAQVELWAVPSDPDAVYVVPRPGSSVVDVERWPVLPFGGHCH